MEGSDSMAKKDTEDKEKTTTGPVRGDFVAPPEIVDVDEQADALPAQIDW